MGELDNVVFSNFNKTMFFDKWKIGKQSLQLIGSTKCDQNCSYCYYKNFGDKLSSKGSDNDDVILNNLSIFLTWLKNNEYKPREVALFGGEFFSTNIWQEILRICNDLLPKEQIILIPTNMSFIMDDNKIENFFKIQEERNNIILSASIDGKFVEENRQLMNGKIRDDNYYDKLFSFCSKTKTGFHPMIYSSSIGRWKENFLWFIENLNKYKLNINLLYLLEVRNKEWNINQAREFYKFISFLVEWLFVEIYNSDSNNFVNNFFTHGFNILSGPFVRFDRGIGCSIQHTFMTNLGDLSIPACHRLSYKELIGGRFVTKDNEIVGMEAANFCTYINIKSEDTKSHPHCQLCLIKNLCTNGCFGSQYEETGNLFLPIPSVCRIHHVKMVAILKTLKKLGIIDKFLERLGDEKKINSILILEKENLI